MNDPETPPKELKAKQDIANSNRISALDGIRGVAILGVLIGHMFGAFVTDSSWLKIVKAIASVGTFGVDLFFVLSGFLITKILLQNHGAKNLLKVFWIRRLARIMPLYLVFLLVMFSTCAIFYPSNFPATPWWSYFLYLQNFYLATGTQVNHFGFDITWSLVLEEHFYLFFPILLACVSKNHHLRIILMVCAIGLPMRHLVHPWLQNEFHLVRLNSLYLSGRIDELGCGALLAYLVNSKISLNKKLFSPFLAIFAWVIVGLSYWTKNVDYLLTGFAGFITIGTCVGGHWSMFPKVFENFILRFFGRISYALYLFHSPLFWICSNYIRGDLALIGLLVAAVFAIWLAWLSTRYFEEPILFKARKYRYDSNR